MGAAVEQGFPALCSPPAPSAHGRHVISCSFFAPPIISAPGSAHGGALPPVSRFSHLRWPRARTPGNHFPCDLPEQAVWHSSPQAFQEPPSPDVAPATHWGRGDSRRCAGHAASYPVFVLNQTFMFSPRGFQSQTVCTESGSQQPEPRELQPPRLVFIFFLKSYGPVFAREFQTMERDRALTEGKK